MARGWTFVHEAGTSLEPAPSWLIEACGKAPEKPAVKVDLGTVNQDLAVTRAKEYLLTAQASISGAGGNSNAYAVAAKVKDFGVPPPIAIDLLLDHWNPRCQPPWSPEEVESFVDHAFRYGQNPPGALAPEADFKEPLPQKENGEIHPVEKLNQKYAFVVTSSGHQIIEETKDIDGRFALLYRPEASFHAELAAHEMELGNGKKAKITKIWMSDAHRRSYKGVCFRPEQPVPPDWYNLWRGFAYTPWEVGVRPPERFQKAVDAFLEHALKNVCRGDMGLYRWLIGFFAHLVQRPWEKPLVALVFKGQKGVGKNALVDRVGALLGHHYLLTATKRYLTGQFNGHLENLLLFALDEAFWSGDKQVEGVLKDLITGSAHVIERKGQEPYRVENRLRLTIIGNEDWQVPASHDERRFAVFDVGAGRQKDRAFFQEMREAMEAGGYRVLLRFLMNYDLAGIDVNDAPTTAGLLEQKIHTLEPLPNWWFECLHEGRVIGSEFGPEWPKTITKDSVRDSFRRYIKDRNIRSRVPSDIWVGRMLSQMCPGLKSRQGKGGYEYEMPPLAEARERFAKFIGHPDMWRT